MSHYTIQLRELIDNGYKIFDFEYPIFDPAYKSVLEQKIIDWYYFREIGLETPAQFKHFLKSKMNVIMPYYNQWYEAQDVFKTYDPYKNKNVTQTDTKTSTTDTTGQTDSTSHMSQTGENSSTTSGTTTAKETFSDTPQAKLQGLDYATNYTETSGDTGSDSTGTSTSTGDGTGTVKNTGNMKTTDEYVSTIAGHDGMKYPTDILLGLRQTFVNLDQQIIEELSVLFLNIA
jgi:hypothetical protein